jgi:hypothetical protein
MPVYTSLPLWLYTATRGAHVYKLIIEQGVKVKYAHLMDIHMCGGVSIVDLVQSIPKQLRPTGEEIQKMISEFSEKQDSIEIDLDEDADESICCQHFIDFWEHHLHPWFVKMADLNKYPHPDNYLQEIIDKLNETNCASLFQQPGLDYALKEIQTQDDSALRRAQEKYIGDIYWWAHQFNECLEGREFDFSDYQEETLAIL